jgi:hypothetical protein
VRLQIRETQKKLQTGQQNTVARIPFLKLNGRQSRNGKAMVHCLPKLKPTKLESTFVALTQLLMQTRLSGLPRNH